MDGALALALLLSGASGLSLGMLGGGGSILAMLMLVYVAGVAAHDAVAMSLAIVGTTSIVASVVHGRQRRLAYRVATIFGGGSIVGALIGARFTPLVSDAVLLLSFAALMLVVGTAVAVGSAAAVTGTIGGFVGLVVPHLLRLLVGYQPSQLLLASALGGSALTLAADIAVRPREWAARERGPRVPRRAERCGRRLRPDGGLVCPPVLPLPRSPPSCAVDDACHAAPGVAAAGDQCPCTLPGGQ